MPWSIIPNQFTLVNYPKNAKTQIDLLFWNIKLFNFMLKLKQHCKNTWNLDPFLNDGISTISTVVFGCQRTFLKVNSTLPKRKAYRITLRKYEDKVQNYLMCDINFDEHSR